MKLSLTLVAALAVGVFAVGCASPTGADDTATSEGAATSASHELSQDMLCAVVNEASQSDGTGLKTIKESALKGDSLKDYKEFQKGMASDYPSAAYELPVKFQNKTYDFILVLEENDGGGYMGVYRTDGSTVVTMSQSESGDPQWSDDKASKCGN